MPGGEYEEARTFLPRLASPYLSIHHLAFSRVFVSFPVFIVLVRPFLLVHLQVRLLVATRRLARTSHEHTSQGFVSHSRRVPGPGVSCTKTPTDGETHSTPRSSAGLVLAGTAAAGHRLVPVLVRGVAMRSEARARARLRHTILVFIVIFSMPSGHLLQACQQCSPDYIVILRGLRGEAASGGCFPRVRVLGGARVRGEEERVVRCGRRCGGGAASVLAALAGEWQPP